MAPLRIASRAYSKSPYDDTMTNTASGSFALAIFRKSKPSITGMLQNGRVLSAELAKDPAKLARVLKYLDYICYGPGLDLVCYGIEGVHWNRVNGKIVPTNRIGEVSYSWQHQNMKMLVVPHPSKWWRALVPSNPMDLMARTRRERGRCPQE